MAAKPIRMNQIRQIVQNRSKGVSKRRMSKLLGISRNTVRSYIIRLESSGMNWAQLLDLTDAQLSVLCYGDTQKPPPGESRYAYVQSKLNDWAAELKNPKVTRQLLWEEYREEQPGGYGYSQFCYYLSQYLKTKQISAIFHHRPAEKLMVDFAGSELQYIEKESGEVFSCPVFVSVLPYSNYIYCEAVHTQQQADFVKALTNCFTFIAGVPQCVVVDNMKTVVKKANRYEPRFSDLCEQLSVHYSTTFMATRVRKPKDKASVENAVKLAYHRIYAVLRKSTFHSLEELNRAIKIALEHLNKRPFKGKQYSRTDLFKDHEKHRLNTLPDAHFVVKNQVSAKVQKNYHIILGQDMHQYSVPYSYVGKQVRVVYTTEWVEVYHKFERIALHKRNYMRHGYTTDSGHLAPNHRAVYQSRGWNADYFIRSAQNIGPNTKSVIERILKSRAFPEQTYNSCLGILRLANKYGEHRLEKASELLAFVPRVNYTLINNILKNNMDKMSQEITENFTTPKHDNVRGAFSFFE
jgi:transposase